VRAGNRAAASPATYDNGTLPLRIVLRYLSSPSPHQDFNRCTHAPVRDPRDAKAPAAPAGPSPPALRATACEAGSGMAPRLRTSINSNSSLSRSMQDKTASCFRGIGHLLKTFRHHPTHKANKKQIVFSPNVRPLAHPYGQYPFLRRNSLAIFGFCYQKERRHIRLASKEKCEPAVRPG
jgi:hypothetical protein